ncbi:alpha/beta fold hydrolase [Altererythrobacter soli]|uniref:Alpha/beta fold hydrolase n=1 Tax=Croceibacterium soli TaxID=1739690 RepID=A0A6I4UWH1_9SPHN|nr:alpha/beta hydrolase [Croceibacterium soli]MXP42224.1 alpha/beta fold hydrolase [Croceibacterium soli]
MANYVLVHGAWGGGQSYDQTAEDLRAAGHAVLVAQLAGLGSRSGELHPGITLTDHIDDVCGQVEQAGFDRFILVGHSYGGMVITGVAARLGARIDAIAYLDAFLPLDGESLWDITGEYEHAWYIDSQKFTPGLVAPIGTVGFEPVPGMVGRHPLLTLLEAVRYTGEEAKIPRRAYVFATDWQPTPFARFLAHAQAEGGWDCHESKASHYVMADQPEQTREILLGLAAPRTG